MRPTYPDGEHAAIGQCSAHRAPHSESLLAIIFPSCCPANCAADPSLGNWYRLVDQILECLRIQRFELQKLVRHQIEVGTMLLQYRS